MSREMPAFLEAVMPRGSIWQPKEDGDLVHLLAGMGENAQAIYEEIDAVGKVRDPYGTELTADLEKELGILSNESLLDTTRSEAMAAVKYTTSRTSSWENLQTFLRASGFDDIVVTPNDPAVDPETVSYGAGTSAMVVNGDLYTSQSPDYMTVCEGPYAYAGEPRFICGYYVNILRTPRTYPIAAVEHYWRFVFWVGGAASGWPGSPAIAPYTLAEDRYDELVRLILKFKPLRAWGILVTT